GIPIAPDELLRLPPSMASTHGSTVPGDAPTLRADVHFRPLLVAATGAPADADLGGPDGDARVHPRHVPAALRTLLGRSPHGRSLPATALRDSTSHGARPATRLRPGYGVPKASTRARRRARVRRSTTILARLSSGSSC